MRKCLRKVLKHRGVNSINYYEFLMHPTSFSKSVDNVFHMTFLIKVCYSVIHIETLLLLGRLRAPSRERGDRTADDR